jgi:hypothetical protein
LEAFLDEVGIAHVVRMEEGPQAGFARPLGVLEGGPAGEQITEDPGVFVLKPLQDLRDIRLECSGEPIGEAHLVGHQGPALLHQSLQGAHGRALRLQCGELIAVRHQPFERQLRVGGVVLGVAEAEGFAILRQRGRMDGKQHEAGIRLQRVDQWPLAQLQAHGDGASFEALLQPQRPLRQALWTMGQHAELARVVARRLQTDVVLAIRPVDADEGGRLGVGESFHHWPPKC